jgi:transcription factor MBP1
MRGEETPDNVTIVSESAYDDYDQPYLGSRKRRRIEDQASQSDKEFRLWADELLDYFMLQDNPHDALPAAPEAPANANLNRAIDDKGHSALHWAAAMGDLEVMKDLIRRGAATDNIAKNGETPLMRAVIFTNCFDKQNMDRLAGLLIRTVNMQEWYGNTVFHHIANTTQRKSKYQCARYYMDALLNKMAEVLPPHEVEHVLNMQDHNGDTAITIAARTGARKCVRSLIGRNAAVDIPNYNGETADQLIVQLNHRRQERVSNRQMSSSPFQADGAHHSANGIPFDPLVPHTSINSGSHSRGADVYKSEAALTLTAQIMPVIVDKARNLAGNLDAEIAQKDEELAEAERLLNMRRNELEALMKQQEDLHTQELQQTQGGAESDEQMERELEDLEMECQQLTEEEEALNFDRLLSAEKARQGHLANTPNGGYAEDDEESAIREKLRVVREVMGLHRERVELVSQIVQNLSMVGYGGKQDMYRQLISGALGVKQEDVESVLKDIVSELEEARGLEAVGA